MMIFRTAANRAAMIAAILFLLPAEIGAGEAGHGVLAPIRLAALIENPAQVQKPDRSVNAKWRDVRERMRSDLQAVAECRDSPATCMSEAAATLSSIIDVARLREGRALVGEVNRAINLAIRPVPDERRHGQDVWSSPLVTLSSGEGDCEDYAIAKLAALWAAGIAEEDTRLVIAYDPRLHEDHAVAMVRLEGRWLALDNRRFTLVGTEHLAYQPLFAIGRDGVTPFAEPTSWAELETGGLPAPSADSSASSAPPVHF